MFYDFIIEVYEMLRQSQPQQGSAARGGLGHSRSRRGGMIQYSMIYYNII